MPCTSCRERAAAEARRLGPMGMAYRYALRTSRPSIAVRRYLDPRTPGWTAYQLGAGLRERSNEEG